MGTGYVVKAAQMRFAHCAHPGVGHSGSTGAHSRVTNGCGRQWSLHGTGDILAPSLMLDRLVNHLLDDRLDDFSESLGGI
jgi:hypothetical protein